MPSVGALTISLKAETESLRADLDKAKRSIAALEQDTKRSSDSMRTAFDKMGSGAVAAGKLAAALAFTSSTLKQFGGEAVETEAKVLSGLSRMAAGYAVGGPLGAGIVAVTELVGLFASAQAEAAEAAKRLSDEVAKIDKGILDDLGKGLETFQKRIESLRGQGASPLQKVGEELAKARRELDRIAAIQDAAGVRLGDMSSMDQIDSDSRAQADNLRVLFNQLHELRALIPLLEGQERREAVLQAVAAYREEADLAAKIAALTVESSGELANVATLTQDIVRLEGERALLARDTTELGQRQVADLDAQLDRLKRLRDATRSSNAARANLDISRAIVGLDPFSDAAGAEVQRKIAEWTKAGASAGLIAAYRQAAALRPTLELARDLYGDLRGAVSAAILDGATNGFRGAADIARSLLDSALRRTIDSLVGAAFSGLGSILGGGGGGILGAVAGIVGGGAGGGIAGGIGSGALPLPST